MALDHDRVAEYLLRKIRVTPSGCFEWRGNGDGGYSTVWMAGRAWKAHRLSFSVFRRPIPDGRFVCHSCDNPPCINPAHLFLGTNADNMRDAKRKGRLIHGVRHPLAKLSPEKVAEAMDLYASGMSMVDVGLRFGVKAGAILKILHGGTWDDVDCVIPATRTSGEANRGEGNGHARLTVEDVVEIRRLSLEGHSQAIIARQFGLCQTQVGRIVRRARWKHVP